MAVSSDGSAANYFIRVATLPNKTPLTIRAVVKVDTHTGYQAFASLNKAGDELFYCGLDNNVDTYVAYLGADGANAGGQLDAGVWATVHYVYDGTNLRIYQDGVKFYDAPHGQAADAAISLTALIASPGVYDSYWRGDMEALAAWERAFDDSEVAADVAYLEPQDTANLWGFWPLDDASDVADASGNGRDLTAVGTPTTVTGSGIPYAPTPSSSAHVGFFALTR
jgi:hypothetical protein